MLQILMEFKNHIQLSEQQTQQQQQDLERSTIDKPYQQKF